MKRLLAIAISVLLLLAIPIASSGAAGSAELGELLISSETVQGSVGDMVKVNFYLYPNLPDGRKLDSLSGSMKYDPAFVTLGAINQVDEEANLTSFMKIGNRTVYDFQHNVVEPGVMRFAFMSMYGAEAEGFWFQAEFRIEKEGATDFIFNGISYSGIDESYKGASFYIEPVSVGGIYTEGENVPEDGAAEETFEPIEPAVETPVPPTPTPIPSNPGQTVPVVSSLPTFSAEPSDSAGLVTLPPAVTSIPMKTPAPQTPAPQTPAQQTPANTSPADTSPAGTSSGAQPSDPGNTGDNPSGQASDPGSTEVDPTGQTSDPAVEVTDPTNTGHVTEAPSTGNSGTGVISEETVGTGKTPNNGQKGTTNETQPNTMLVVGVIIGIIAVLGLGAIAIVMVLKRRKLDD